jgi:hypothetical protein
MTVNVLKLARPPNWCSALERAAVARNDGGMKVTAIHEQGPDAMSGATSFISDRMAILSGIVDSGLRESAFDNHSTLHPRRLAEIGARQVGLYGAFLRSRAPDGVLAEARALAEEGLGERTVIRIASTLSLFCVEQCAHEPALLREAARATHEYTSLLLEGFMAGREALILKEQERIRLALAAAQESQKRERTAGSKDD